MLSFENAKHNVNLTLMLVSIFTEKILYISGHDQSILKIFGIGSAV